MKNFLFKLKILFNRDTYLRYSIKEFAHANKDLLIIVADPKSDRMFVTYRDRFVNGRIKSPTGKKTHVVKEVLKYSRFSANVDGFLSTIMETLNIPIWKKGTNQFFQFIDGAVFNIAKGLRKKATTHADKIAQGFVPSPFPLEEVGRSEEKVEEVESESEQL